MNSPSPAAIERAAPIIAAILIEAAYAKAEREARAATFAAPRETMSTTNPPQSPEI
jgi:hypothetical protein